MMAAAIKSAPGPIWIVRLLLIALVLAVPATAFAAESPVPAPPGQPILEPGYEFGVKSQIYVVHSGDNLTRIAQRFNTSVESLKTVNQLTNPNVLPIGLRLIVPFGMPGAAQTMANPRRGLAMAVPAIQ